MSEGVFPMFFRKRCFCSILGDQLHLLGYWLLLAPVLTLEEEMQLVKPGASLALIVYKVVILSYSKLTFCITLCIQLQDLQVWAISLTIPSNFFRIRFPFIYLYTSFLGKPLLKSTFFSFYQKYFYL